MLDVCNFVDHTTIYSSNKEFEKVFESLYNVMIINAVML